MLNPSTPGAAVGLTAAQPACPEAGPAYFVLVNTLLALFLVGAVIVISNNLTRIPVAAFIVLFSVLTALMLVATLQALQQRRTGWARTWAYWGCVFFGIATISAAHRLGWLAFIPDLILLWLIVFAASAVALHHCANLLVAELLLTLWLVCSFLYGQTYLPGLAICLLLAWQLIRRPAANPLQGPLMLWGSANALLLAAFYVYAAVQPQHYPLQWLPALQLPCLALLALLWSASQLLLARQPPRHDLQRLVQVVQGSGMVLLVLLSVPAVWDALRVASSGSAASPVALGIAGLLGLLCIALLQRAAAQRRQWQILALWFAGAALLELARLFADTVWADLPSGLAAALAAALAWRRLQRALAGPSMAGLLGASWLWVLVLCVSIFSRPLAYPVQVLALWLMAAALGWALWRFGRSAT